LLRDVAILAWKLNLPPGYAIHPESTTDTFTAATAAAWAGLEIVGVLLLLASRHR
jgi:hypothetical protein